MVNDTIEKLRFHHVSGCAAITIKNPDIKNQFTKDQWTSFKSDEKQFLVIEEFPKDSSFIALFGIVIDHKGRRNLE